MGHRSHGHVFYRSRGSLVILSDPLPSLHHVHSKTNLHRSSSRPSPSTCSILICFWGRRRRNFQRPFMMPLLLRRRWSRDPFVLSPSLCRSRPTPESVAFAFRWWAMNDTQPPHDRSREDPFLRLRRKRRRICSPLTLRWHWHPLFVFWVSLRHSLWV